MTDSLYKIQGEYAAFEQLLELIYENPDKPTTEDDERMLVAWLSEIQARLADKLNGVAQWRAGRLGLIEARKAQISALKEMNDRDEARIDRVKELVLMTLKGAGLKKVETPTAVFTVTKEGGIKALVIAEGTKLPDEYLVTKTVVEVDKPRLRIHIENGVVVDGVTLIDKKDTLRIKQ
jgi:hypothetical protein